MEDDEVSFGHEKYLKHLNGRQLRHLSLKLEKERERLELYF
jgi:hypothetical protein